MRIVIILSIILLTHYIEDSHARAQTGFPNGVQQNPQFNFNIPGFPLNPSFPQFPLVPFPNTGFEHNFPNLQNTVFNPFNTNALIQAGLQPDNIHNNQNNIQNQGRPAVAVPSSNVGVTTPASDKNIDTLIGDVFSSPSTADSSTKYPDGLDYDIEVRVDKN